MTVYKEFNNVQERVTAWEAAFDVAATYIENKSLTILPSIVGQNYKGDTINLFIVGGHYDSSEYLPETNCTKVQIKYKHNLNVFLCKLKEYLDVNLLHPKTTEYLLDINIS